MAAYDEAAEVYLASGLFPIPVMGKHQPAAGTTGYDGTVTAEKVNAWLHPDAGVRARAGRGVRVDNIGLRHELTIAVDVDHGYGDKDGVSQLAQFAARAGLPPLPATWSSTARGNDSPSRQYVYRVPERGRFKTKPCPSVELCTWHHRFTVCAPSVHPTTGTAYAWYLPGAAGVPPTWGERTSRYPTEAVFADLPAEWWAALRGTAANADRSAAVVDLPELLATFTDGEPDGLVRHLIAKWSDPEQHVGHDEAKNALIHAFLVGREGHAGVPALYRVIVERYAAYLEIARPAQARAELQSLVTACATIAQQKPVAPLVIGRMPTTAEFMAGARVVPAAPPVPSIGAAFATTATDDELGYFLATYTRYGRPDRLGRRAAWMKSDPPHRLAWHARGLVEDVLAGHYPADRALDALRAAYLHHGGHDPAGARSILSVALGAVLNAKVSA